ncbi:hypothetical protein [Chryseobacterium sp. RR2-3-20]|uniref:hypothetical protein n=1 Tax=Chryseobacterium sp. RR2-3-20 TaxID=2787626 RepID=UPI001ADED321|nr:hypothetical protein [Chryseobacterium sp. RR2-3-20]
MGNIEHNTIHTLNSGSGKEIYLVGSKSQYYFYITKSNKTLNLPKELNKRNRDNQK